MNRRLFLQVPLAASALLAHTQALAQVPSSKGFKVARGEDRFQEELNIMGGQFRRMVSAKDTGGELLIYDTVRQEKGGPAYHFHYHQDEWFYVMRGEFIVKVGEDTVHLKAGDSAFAPRMIPHAFAMVNEGEGQMMVLFQPAGSMEDFFREMSTVGKSIPKDQETKLKELWARHGMQIVGPPLKW